MVRYYHHIGRLHLTATCNDDGTKSKLDLQDPLLSAGDRARVQYSSQDPRSAWTTYLVDACCILALHGSWKCGIACKFVKSQ